MSKYLDTTTLKRDPAKVKKSLKEVNNAIIATDEVRIIFPQRFTKKSMCNLNTITDLACYYCMIDKNNNYAVTTSPVMQSLKPDNVSLLTINKSSGNDEKYLYICLTFHKDSTVITNTSLIQNTDIFFGLMQEFFINGNIPWYLNYEDVANSLLESSKYTGNSMGDNPMALEILTSLISKAPDGRKPFKEILKKREDIFKVNPHYIGLSDVMSYSDTGSKLIGSNFELGLTSALNADETKTSDATALLRK